MRQMDKSIFFREQKKISVEIVRETYIPDEKIHK